MSAGPLPRAEEADVVLTDKPRPKVESAPNAIMMRAMDYARTIKALLLADPPRWSVLGRVQSLGLPDCWVGAGFVRNAVWDSLHGFPASRPVGDIDVLWFDPDRVAPSVDDQLEAELRALDPAIGWSVKNQARMHVRNGDAPYISTADAMRYWPETATAVAARRTESGGCEITAPFGLDDLFALIVRPTPRFLGEKHRAYLKRVDAKGWRSSWPRLRMEAG